MVPCSGFAPEDYDLFALGILDSEEGQPIRDHVRRGCGTCRAEVGQSLSRVSELALVAADTPPPSSLRRRLMFSVRKAESEESSRGGWFWPGLALATVAALILLNFAAYFWTRSAPAATSAIVSRLSPPPVPSIEEPRTPTPVTIPPAVAVQRIPADSSAAEAELVRQHQRNDALQSQLQSKDEELVATRNNLQDIQGTLQSRVAELERNANGTSSFQPQYQAKIDELNRQIEIYKTLLERQRRLVDSGAQSVALLTAPDLRIVNLRATEQGGAASARALVSGDGHAVLYATRLPALPPGRTYQLWLTRSRGPAIVSAGIFRPLGSQVAVLPLENAHLLAGATALAVTEEPAGGSQLPTGHKVLVGLISPG